jgi:hypothetical protein
MSDNEQANASESRIATPDQGEGEGAPTVATVGAVLAVDVGSLYTRAALFDVIGEEYRFVARSSAFTTAEAPHSDVTAGVYNAVRELEQATGRHLTDGTRLLMPQRRDSSGIDLFIATSSAAPALRLVTAAVSSDISGESAVRAAQSIYSQMVSRITLDEGIQKIPAEDEGVLSTAAVAWLQEETDKLLALPPDVVLLAGGIDNGPVAPLIRLARVVSTAAREQGSRAERAARVGRTAPGMPTVVFAGNATALGTVTEAMAPVSDIRSVPNLRPNLQSEQTAPAEAALSEMYRDRQLPQIPGAAVLSRWIEGPIVPTVESERLIARYLYAHYGRETMLVDVGATSTSLFLAGVRQDQAVVLGDIGLAYGLGNLLAERGAENILHWLPFEMSHEELTDWVLNKVIRPLALPQTARDLAIEQALAREAIVGAATALRVQSQGSRPKMNWPEYGVPSGARSKNQEGSGQEPRYDLLIGTGGLLAHTPRPGQAALLMLDALQPTAESLGSVELAVDTTMLVAPIGNLARHHPAAAAYIFDRDCLVWLGSTIVLHGRPPESSAGGVTVTVERQQGGTETVEVPYGSIQVVPLRPDQRAALTVKPTTGLWVGTAEPGKTLKTQPGQEVKGGLVGLMIDARGRPLHLPTDPDARRSTVRRWWAAFDAIPAGENFQTGPFTAAPQYDSQNISGQLDTAEDVVISDPGFPA